MRAHKNHQGRSIIGIDEAGRGPLAGPVVAAGVVLDQSRPILGLNDSKKLSATMRDKLYQQIMERAAVVVVEQVSVEVIDRINILQATLLAMKQVVMTGITLRAIDLALVDGNAVIPDLSIAQEAIVGGDGLIESIMAASIIAKVHRDRLMKELAQQFPGYGFEHHKGYGTPQHLAALARLGPTAIHRMSFAPLKDARHYG